jgi:hypothetical protein
MDTRATCGIWRGGRGLVAVVVDEDGLVAFEGYLPLEEAWPRWLSTLAANHGANLSLVLSDRCARRERIGRVAVRLGYQLLIAPTELVTPLSRAAWSKPSARQLAALLARLPRIRAFRSALRANLPRSAPKQMALFGQ